MGVPPLRGRFETPKISAEGPLQESQYGSAFGPASGTGQTSKCNQKGRNQRMLQCTTCFWKTGPVTSNLTTLKF